MGSVIVSNQNNSISKDKDYTVNDLIDIHACAQDTLENMSALLSAIEHEEDKLITYLGKAYGIHKEHFNTLRRLINITHCTANEFVEYHDERVKDLENNKGGRNA